MSSPNHLTSSIDDAFSSNFLNFIPASPDYVPASPGKTYSSSSNSFGLVPIVSPTLSLFHDDPYMKIRESARKTSLERHEEKIEEILNHLDELSLDRIEYMEDKTEGLGKFQNATQKDVQHLKQPAILGLHQETSSDSESTSALEVQAATIAGTSNPNRNTGHIGTPVAKTGNYKEFISCQPFYFNGNDLKTYIRRFQELAVLMPDTRHVPNTENSSNRHRVSTFCIGMDWLCQDHAESSVTRSRPHPIDGETLNPRVGRTLILALPEGNDDVVVYCDAYHQGLGAMLMQREKRAEKERILNPLRIRSLIMTVHPKLSSQILKAQTEALKEENIKAGNLRGMDKAFEVHPDGTR
ncbi:hypothetical protein Tco_0875287 [Tanacetum coccineum]|uniref:Reverse transcriptase/retrotransposon-derived protein RNase H-like domain-containing protein n=1 Tax=Tanacetum coccineum TaxID=301880 RepID=A0ABQ5BP14_9ASTR